MQHVVLGGKIAATVVCEGYLALHRTLTSTLCCLLASLFALLAFFSLLALARLVPKGKPVVKGGTKPVDELKAGAFGGDSVGKLQS